eukprot:CAMPEP_0204054034 /NCGR_PEP_ID=MMETSP0360-20130528/127803_1 /ASSEMBLY_ACC=CAM_ASM_000342 /TAXON_ID=268821 /ORGANISM="Scrippsiella Hangoei, Strain SHTV-5" /LENGTH=100 /DNA_ID=CAMNT_0051001273 /DNA_START=17 /DNA_END=315 /DNA_ORIENTATION=+
MKRMLKLSMSLTSSFVSKTCCASRRVKKVSIVFGSTMKKAGTGTSEPPPESQGGSNITLFSGQFTDGKAPAQRRTAPMAERLADAPAREPLQRDLGAPSA